MKRYIIALMCAISVFAQSTAVPGNRTFTGAVDISGATSQKNREGNTLPATCSAGESFLLTVFIPNVNKTCVATNVWAALLGGATYGGIPLLSPSLGQNGLPPVITALSSRENDLYTAPSCTAGTIGCQRYLLGVTVAATSSSDTATINLALKRSGIYYPLGALGGLSLNTTAISGAASLNGAINASTVAAGNWILDPGDTIAVNVSAMTGGTYNAILNRVAFDSSTPFRTVTYLSPQTGSSLALYTPSTGKTGIVLANQGIPFRNSSTITAGVADAGIDWSYYLAPTGAPLSNSNRIGFFTSAITTAQLSAAVPSIVPPGYTLYATVSGNASNSIIYFWVFEF